MKSRIVALALIVIVLSSSSFSAVDGYSVSFTIKDVKEFTHKLNGNNYQITLLDAVAATIVNQNYFDTNFFKIDLQDGVGVRLTNDNYPVDPGRQNQINSQTFSVQLEDSAGVKTNYSSNDNDAVKIIKTIIIFFIIKFCIKNFQLTTF